MKRPVFCVLNAPSGQPDRRPARYVQLLGPAKEGSTVYETMVATLGTQVVGVVRLNAAASTLPSATTVPLVLAALSAVLRDVVDIRVGLPASHDAVGVATPEAATGNACT